MSSAAVTPYVPESDASISDMLRALQPGLTIYRASNEWYEIQYAGDCMWIPPDLDGHPEIVHPYKRGSRGGEVRVKADGRLLIKDKYGAYIKQLYCPPGAAVERSTEELTGDIPGQAARNIVTFILRKHGAHGVVLLTGNPDKDEVATATSRRLIMNSKRDQATEIVAAFRERVENYEKDPNKHRRQRPKPTYTERQAQMLLDDLKEANEITGAFMCEFGCPVETNDFDIYARHMWRAHREKKVRADAITAPDPAAALNGPVDLPAAGASTIDEGARLLSPARIKAIKN